MPIVEVDGQELEFPDTMSGDEIKSVLMKKYPPALTSSNLENKNFFQRVGDDTTSVLLLVNNLLMLMSLVINHFLKL